MIGQWPTGFKRIEFPLNKALQSPKHSKELLKLGPPLFVFQDFLFCFVPTDDEHSCHGHSCFHERLVLKNCTAWSQKCQRIGPGNENLCIFDQVLQSLFAPVGQPSRSMPQWISDLTWSNYRDIFVELVAMMVGWCWLMISLGIIYGTLYIGDYTSPWTGNPVLKHAVWREDRGCWTLLEWKCVIDAAKNIDEEELNIGWTQHFSVYVCLFYELKTLKLN